MSEAYKAAGVNLEMGDELSDMLYRAAQETWPNRAGLFGQPSASIDSFSSLRSMSIEPLMRVKSPGNLRFLMNDDGVGTKVEVAQRVGDLSTIAFDLIAMVADDAAIRGFEPVAASTTLDVRKLEEAMRPRMIELGLGYIAAANAAKIAVVNGEVAELGNLVGGFRPRSKKLAAETLNFNWSATLMSVGNKVRLLDGSKVQPGDSLVGLAEYGFRSNGLSLVRKTLTAKYGGNWHKTRVGIGHSLGRLVLEPSTIYASVLTDASGGYDTRNKPKAPFHAAAHITGGGIPGKVGRMLEATGLGADIEAPFEPGYILQLVQSEAKLPDKEAYKVWNMGQGMVVATDQPDKFIRLARQHGHDAEVIGEVTKEPGIKIRSAGRAKGRMLKLAA